MDKIKYIINDLQDSKYKYAIIAGLAALFLFLLFIGVNEAIDSNLAGGN